MYGSLTQWSIAIGFTFFYAGFAEYAAHRWTMHYPGLGKASWWKEHAIEHHAKGRNDINIDLSAFTTLFAGAPLLVFCPWLGWPWVSFVMLACTAYAALWSNLHAAYHEISDSWLARLPFFAYWKAHHMRHHLLPDRNFGTVFIYMDWLFGTHASSRLAALPDSSPSAHAVRRSVD